MTPASSERNDTASSERNDTASSERNDPEVPPADRIEVRGLRLEAVHGVAEGERSAPQPFEVDLDLCLSLSPAGSSDELEDTCDYATAVSRAVSVLLGPPRRLLETLAEEMARALLADGRVEAVTVAVRKLRPPVEHQLASAGVRITRRR
ncbi:MAG TPA: dihydroneopterin aldolase [Acidimicrobiales bacterium]|nr:dihydroneopterin aldolase [Acidimicrobiales bacterium]